jgi:hypothetical protein
MNVFCYVKQGKWEVGPGGYPWPTLVGPFSNSQIAERVKWELMEKFPAADQKYPSKGKRKELSAGELRYRSHKLSERVSITRQVGGDYGDALAYDGIWRRGSNLLILRALGECLPYDEWEVYTFDLEYFKDLDGWIKWDRVESCCGVEDGQWHDSVTRVEDAASYYGWNEVAGEPDHYIIRKGLLDRLVDFGVDVSGYRSDDDDLATEEQLQAWRNGDLSSLEGSKYAYLKRGWHSVDTSETSNACGPSDFKDALPSFIRYMKRWFSTEWLKPDPQEFVGYKTEVIEEDDRIVVKVGCNHILLSEIIRFIRDDLKMAEEADQLEEISNGKTESA